MSDTPYTPPENPSGHKRAGETAPSEYPPSSSQAYPPPQGQYPPPPGYLPPQSHYPPPPGQYPPPGYGPNAPYPPQAAAGLSDTAAGALAYVTIIPAIIFLVMAPYNTRPFIKFHAFQCLGLAVFGFCLGIVGVIPILGWIIVVLGSIALLVLWVLCIIKASQGSAFKLPVIGDFAAQQSGYTI